MIDNEIEELKAEIEYLTNFLNEIKNNKKYTDCLRNKIIDRINMKKYEIWKKENNKEKDNEKILNTI